MDLPGELRNLIYFYVLKSEASTKLVRCQHHDRSSAVQDGKVQRQSSLNVCLLRTNRQIYGEATAVFYAYNTFSVCATGIEYAFSSTACRSLKCLEIFEGDAAQKLELKCPENSIPRSARFDYIMPWEKAIRVINTLPALERLIVNFGNFYTSHSTGAKVSRYPKGVVHSTRTLDVTRTLVYALQERREAGRGDVKLESVKLSFADLKWFHRVLYPESNE